MAETKTATTEAVAKQKRNYGPKEPVDIVIEDVVKMLEDGKTRPEIMQHYGLNAAQLAVLFKEPELHGKKTKKDYSKAFKIIRRSAAPQGEAAEVSNDGTATKQSEEAKSTTGWE